MTHLDWRPIKNFKEVIPDEHNLWKPENQMN